MDVVAPFFLKGGEGFRVCIHVRKKTAETLDDGTCPVRDMGESRPSKRLLGTGNAEAKLVTCYMIIIERGDPCVEQHVGVEHRHGFEAGSLHEGSKEEPALKAHQFERLPIGRSVAIDPVERSGGFRKDAGINVVQEIKSIIVGITR